MAQGGALRFGWRELLGISQWEYPNGKDTIQDPTDQTTPRELNFGAVPFWHGSVKFTSIGETTGQSAYGVYDMGGNIDEWTDTLADPKQGVTRITCGGAFLSDSHYLCATNRHGYHPLNEGDGFGFRVAFMIPEPTTMLLILFGLPVLILFRRKISVDQ